MGEISQFDVGALVEGFDLRFFVETGTLYGNGLEAVMGCGFQELHSIEIDEGLAEKAAAKFAGHEHVRVHPGNSPEVLGRILPGLRGNALFWLDAHFPGADTGEVPYEQEQREEVRLPLELELQEIAARAGTFQDVLVIDDISIYEDGPYEWGNFEARSWLGGESCEFIYERFRATHALVKCYERGGYLLLLPRRGGRRPVVQLPFASRTRDPRMVLQQGERAELRRMLAAERPVAYLPDGIGDLLMLLPALRALGRLFGGRLSVHCPESRQALLKRNADVRATYRWRLIEGWFDGEQVPPELRDCDLFLSLAQFESRAFDRLVRFLDPEWSVGFDECCRYVLPLDPARHGAVLGFDVARFLRPEVRLVDFALPLRLGARPERAAGDLRAEAGEGVRVLAIHPETHPGKRLAQPVWARVIQGFLERHPDWIALILGCDDHQLDGGACGERVIPCHGVPLETSLALVGQADLFAGIDSCMLHAADLFGVPSVGIFGPSDFSRWGFHFTRHEYVVGGDGRLELVSADHVVAALERLAGELEDRVEAPGRTVPAPAAGGDAR